MSTIGLYHYSAHGPEVHTHAVTQWSQNGKICYLNHLGTSETGRNNKVVEAYVNGLFVAAHG